MGAEKYDFRMKRLRDRQWEKKNAGKCEQEQKEKEALEEEAAALKLKEEEETKKRLEKERKEAEKTQLKVSRRDLRSLQRLHAPTLCPDQFQELILTFPAIPETVELHGELVEWVSAGKNLLEKVSEIVRERMGVEPTLVDPPREGDTKDVPNTVSEENTEENKKDTKKNKKKKVTKVPQKVAEDAEEDRITKCEQQMDQELGTKGHHAGGGHQKKAGQTGS